MPARFGKEHWPVALCSSSRLVDWKGHRRCLSHLSRTCRCRAVREIRLAADRGRGWIIFERWGPIKGAGAKLLSTLLAEFDQAAEEKLAPEHYPFVSSRVLARQLACDSDETLRRQVLRLRTGIRRLAKSAGEPAPPDDVVIENQPGRGYRLNPELCTGGTGHRAAPIRRGHACAPKTSRVATPDLEKSRT